MNLNPLSLVIPFVRQVVGKALGSAGVFGASATGAGFLLNRLSKNNGFSNLMRSWTGSGLTDAQIQQNEFNAQQAELQRSYEERLSNTANQRAVVDMESAGLNPALMYGSGSSSSTPSGASASAGSVSSGLGFGELVNMLTLPMQLAQMRANIDNVRADASLKSANVENVRLDNEFLRKSLNARVRGVELSNNLSEAEIKQVDANRGLILQSLQTEIEKTKNEAERNALIHWDSQLKKASANQIVELLPYQELLLQAQTESQKATALAQFYNAAYNAKLIDSGYIETQIETMRQQARASLISASASASQAATASRLADANIGMIEVNKSLTEFKNSVFRGDVFDTSGSWYQAIPAKALNGAFNLASIIATSVGGPLSGLIGAAK